METAQMILAERIDFAALMEPVALKLLGEPNAKLSNPPRDMRFGSRGSMAVDYEGGKWFDHEAKIGGGVLDLISRETGRNRGGASVAEKRRHLLPLPCFVFGLPQDGSSEDARQDRRRLRLCRRERRSHFPGSAL